MCLPDHTRREYVAEYGRTSVVLSARLSFHALSRGRGGHLTRKPLGSVRRADHPPLGALFVSRTVDSIFPGLLYPALI
jgi:hypothetical protein